MNILNVLMIAQVVLSVLLTISILLQNRAEGLGTLFGGGGEVFRTKRGLENLLYYVTIVLAVIISVMSLVIVKLTK
ncbi:preprotein translocase subunit SecG [Candidatus Dojkabacteria bacterium]|jgi:preprotein translocase subunit SecG|nr:preprotein translocase subunit SecG [Candidatus Dojkabacteria bacterium]